MESFTEEMVKDAEPSFLFQQCTSLVTRVIVFPRFLFSSAGTLSALSVLLDSCFLESPCRTPYRLLLFHYSFFRRGTNNGLVLVLARSVPLSASNE